MRRHLGFLLKDTAIYGLASGASRFVKVLLVPIVARQFSPEIFGVFDSAGVYVYVLAVLGVLGVDSAVILAARDATPRDATPETIRAGRRRAMATAFTIALAASGVLAVLLAAAPALWSRALLDSERYAGAIRWAAATVPCTAVLVYTLSLLKWEFRRSWFLAASLGSALASVAFTYYSAFHTSAGLTGLMAASFAGQLLGALIGCWACRDLIGLRLDRDIARRTLAVGLPFAVVGVASGIAPSLDRLFLTHAHTLADAGLYGVGQKVATLQALVLSGFQAAWGPFAFSMEHAPGKGPLFGRVFLLIAVGGSYFTLGLVTIAPWLARTAAGAEYVAATAYVLPLGLSIVLATIFFVVSIGAFLEGRTAFNLYAYVAGVAVTVALNVLLVALRTPPVGIAWANCFGQAASVTFMAWLAQRVHPVPYPFARGAVTLVAAGAVGLLISGWAPGAGVVPVAGVLAALTAAVGVWTWLGVLSPSERRALRLRLGHSAGEP